MAERTLWTPEKDAELRRLAPTGLGSRGIMALLHCGQRAVLDRARRLKIAIAVDPAYHAKAADARRRDRLGGYDAALRQRWVGLIGPMKARLRAEIELPDR